MTIMHNLQRTATLLGSSALFLSIGCSSSVHFASTEGDGGAGAGGAGANSCTDGIKNGHETDIDCGGDCGACVCPAGFGDCTDAPGCETDLNTIENCGVCGVVVSPHGFCMNGVPTCSAGFFGDGVTCNENSGCGINDNCDVHATCNNTSNGPNCVCNDGYTGDGITCTPLPCTYDNFDQSGGAGWQLLQGDWHIMSGAGPDGSDAFGSTLAPHKAIGNNPMFDDATTFTLDYDFKLLDPNFGDHHVILRALTNPNENYYTAGIYAAGGDSSPDAFREVVGGVVTTLTTHSSDQPANVWHHLTLTRLADGTISVMVDGNLHLNAAPNTIPPPYSIAFHFYSGGVIDSVKLCK